MSAPFPTDKQRAAVRLADWGVIRAQGEDARKFLHGQLTQDVEHLQVGTARLAGYCSAKGRLLATFVMWSPAADLVMLACSADLLPGVLKRLSMFVLRAKCRLSDDSANLPVWGWAGPGVMADADESEHGAVWGSQGDGSPAQGWMLRLPDARTPEGQRFPRHLQVGGPAPAETALPLPAWLALEALSGVPRVVAATSEAFVPQMVNLELVGGVNFQKGCYPGQEVVARSQYRGTVKRRAQVMLAAEPTQPGEAVFYSDDAEQPAGQVVLAGVTPAGQAVALVELKLAALAQGSLHLRSASGPSLTLGTLPYSLPSETP